MNSLSWSTHGKWILAGEHSVLRGCPALVFPLYACRLNCKYQATPEPLKVKFSGPEGEPLRLLFWGVVENALERKERVRTDLRGHLEIDSNLPLGTGLGASGALCAAIGQWWKQLGWIEETEVYEFSRSLEDMFHGESSGVDVAAAMANNGFRFMRGGERQELKIHWQPNWYLSYSGRKGVTSECITRVKGLNDKDPELFAKLDRQMQEAVEKSERALSAPSEETGLPEISQAIQMARDCFKQWGLIDGDLKKHIADLEASGAIAVKPTGSGGGGHVLSLWQTPPPKNLPFSLMPLDPIGRSGGEFK